MIILSLSGKKDSGKNTIAAMITDMTPLWCCEVAYADALKCEVALACGVTTQFINQNKPLFRPILQWWGTDFRRQLEGDGYWIAKFDKTCVTILKEKRVEVLLITDARFPNEVEYAQSIGAICINVVRPNSDKDPHLSETANDQTIFDWCIQNDGTLADLEKQVKELVTKLGIKLKI